MPALSVVGLALLAGCWQGASAPAARSPHAVHYVVEWAVDGIEWTPDHRAWEVTNDLGYRVRVTRGYLTSYSMELVECPRATATPPVARNEIFLQQTVMAMRSIGAALDTALVGTAHAGHASGTPNPAAIRPMQIESLLEPRPREVGTVLLQPQAYCQLHYLAARASGDARDLPADVDMADTTLHVEGAYRGPGTTTDTAFTVHSALANGGLVDHTSDGTPIRVDPGGGALRVTVRRRLARIFDGVAFAAMDERARARQILQSVIDHLEVTIEAEHATR